MAKDRKRNAAEVLADTVETIVAKAGRQKVGKVAQTTLSRLAGNESNSNPRLSTLQQLADSQGVQVWQLLVPGFDPDHPPKLVGEGAAAHGFEPHEVALLMNIRKLTPANRTLITAAVDAAIAEAKAAKEPA